MFDGGGCTGCSTVLFFLHPHAIVIVFYKYFGLSVFIPYILKYTKKNIKSKMETNKIYNGDCLELFKELENNMIDLVVTSPPYMLVLNMMYMLIMYQWMSILYG